VSRTGRMGYSTRLGWSRHRSLGESIPFVSGFNFVEWLLLLIHMRCSSSLLSMAFVI
jgi:hypothetical protein